LVEASWGWRPSRRIVKGLRRKRETKREREREREEGEGEKRARELQTGQKNQAGLGDAARRN